MLGVFVSAPVVCFRKGFAREYLESEAIPPPATCYGFLLSLVGEMDRYRHIGCRVTPVLLGKSEKSTILRTVWRVKSKKYPIGVGNNRTPAQQELFTGVQLVLWVDSSDENGKLPSLEKRTEISLTHPENIRRFGGLSLGESTHLVDVVKIFSESEEEKGSIFICKDRGRLTLPVWVDHVGSEGTQYISGDLEILPLIAPDKKHLPQINPFEGTNKIKK